MRTWWIALALVGGLLLGVGFWALQEARWEAELREDAERVATAFLRAWEADETQTMAGLADDPDGLEDAYLAVIDDLGVDSWAFDLDEIELVDETRGLATFDVHVEVAGLGEWQYRSTLDLVRADPAAEDTEADEDDDVNWVVDWSPATVHPELAEDQALASERHWPERQVILDRTGEPLDDSGASLGLIIGAIGEIDEEIADELGEPYLPGDEVGVSGLQRAFETRLAGRPGGEITVVDDDGETVEVLHEVQPVDGEPVRTTIHPDVQRAAEAVATGPPTAIVVSDPATGELLAVANHPPGDWNRAMQARYPPGSTFKVVTAGALLRDGWEPDSPIDCPETRDVGGWTFHNFEDMDLGAIDLETATYESCNTAYVQMTAELDDDVFLETVEDFGFNASLDLPISHRGGTFPAYENVTIKAAAGFGQGQVETSPMHLASVAAAIADGAWRPPALVLDPATEEREVRDVSDVAPTLERFMQLVVERGTAEGRGLPGDVAGKTGTAEWGERDPDGDLPTHAWFMGYAPWEDPAGEVGQVAFAVIVEGGESGGRVAAPLTSRFLAELRD